MLGQYELDYSIVVTIIYYICSLYIIQNIVASLDKIENADRMELNTSHTEETVINGNKPSKRKKIGPKLATFIYKLFGEIWQYQTVGIYQTQ